MGGLSRIFVSAVARHSSEEPRCGWSLALAPLALFGFLAGAATPAPARADFLDDLFGPSTPEPQAAAAPRVKRRDAGQGVKGGLHFMPSGKSAAKLSDKRKLASDGAGGSTVAASFCEAKDEAKDGALDIVMYDKTLRPGDAVVTGSGVQVFRGGGCPHKATDFIALSGAGLSKSQKNTLLAIENVMRRADKD